MSIIKVNTYLADRNITNMAVNVDYNRLGEDKTQISVNYGTTPATVTIKNGSIIECNGNRYLINADYSFQMANAAHNYLTFTDNPAIAFSSAAAIGTFDAEKQGYYQADNLTRTLKFYIDQSGENNQEIIDINNTGDPITTRLFDHVKVCLTANYSSVGVMPLDKIIYDQLSNYDIINYRFNCVYSGYYNIFFQKYGPVGEIQIRKNGTTIAEIEYSSILETHTCIGSVEYLIGGDYVDIYNALNGYTTYAYDDRTYLIISRLL